MRFVWFCVFVSAFTGGFVTEQSPPPPGSYQEVPVNRTDVLEAAQFAVDEFNKANTEDMFNYAILDITSAEVQVVGGFNYFLEMLLGRTTCKTGNAAAVKGNAAAVKGNAAAVKGNAAAVKGNAAAVKGNAAAVKGNAAAVKGNAAANDCDSNSEPKASELKCTFTVNEVPWEDSRVLFQKECKVNH
ncbi:cystatin-D [Etheostoma spectabile]|uniref:cystatin-D n=1 Tax=Etheostoma spectabile TaxID=54343 RepID=UPI0013AF7F4B|nr:cystatin-D-like [Etheostoma spectabile]